MNIRWVKYFKCIQFNRFWNLVINVKSITKTLLVGWFCGNSLVHKYQRKGRWYIQILLNSSHSEQHLFEVYSQIGVNLPKNVPIIKTKSYVAYSESCIKNAAPLRKSFAGVIEVLCIVLIFLSALLLTPSLFYLTSSLVIFS